MNIIFRIHPFLLSKAQKQPIVLILMSGLLLGLSFPPFPFPFLAFIGWIPLFYIWEYSQKPFWKTYFSLFIWNVIVGYWLCLTILGAKTWEEAFQNFFAGFLANILNPFLMTIPIAFFWFLRKKNSSLYSYLGFIPLWISFEYLHFQWELTWSWLTFGHAFSSFPLYIQFIEWTGIYGASALLLLINVLIFIYLHNPITKMLWRISFSIVFPFIVSIFLILPFRKVYQVEKIWKVRIIQPNIDPYQKFEVTTEENQIDLFTKMYEADGIDSLDLVILPETAIPFGIFYHNYQEDPRLFSLLDAVKKHQVPLLTGCSEYKVFDNSLQAPSTARQYGNQWIQAYNSSTVLGDTSSEFYEKSKLVPFVERTPYYDYLKALENIIHIDLGGGFGNYGIPDSIYCLDGKSTNEIGNVICYESIFPHHVRQLVQKGAKFISVITNDGWWGKSSGYIQHAFYARLRAIETRREVVRCANTGLSIHIDNQGNILKSSSWWKPEYFDIKVRHYNGQTIYVIWGDWFALFALCISFILLVWNSYKSIKTIHPYINNNRTAT